MEDNQEKTECVQVVVRCRPLSGTERTNNNTDIVEMDPSMGQVRIKSISEKDATPKSFTYDSVFPQDSTQEMVYAKAVSHITEFVLDGYNGTIFAYGQTGTGKTHTMEGDIHSAEQKGVMPRAFDHIFAHIARIQSEKNNFQFLVSCQFVEIYMEDVMDLLVPAKTTDRPKLQLKETAEGAIFVAGASKYTVRSSAELLSWLEKGKENRKVGATNMNAGSSRSHCIFTITVETSEVRDDGQEHIRVGKLNLVDLAGSERQGKTGATGQRFKEATRINLSLSALGQVISALTSRTPTPLSYRNSKLTRLLQDSLGGNTKTVMIANIGPADYNHDETVETLRFASRAKLIKNKPKVNEDPRDAMLRQYQDEISKLRQALLDAETLENGDPEAIARLLGEMGGGGAKQEKIVEKVEVVGVQKEEIDKVEEERQRKVVELQQRHAQETAALLSLQNEINTKAQATKEQVNERNRLLEQQRRTKDEILQQLQVAEAQLRLDKDILKQARLDAEMLEMKRIEMEQEEKLAQEKRNQLQKQEEEFFASLQKKNKAEEDLQSLHRKLNRLQEKYKGLKGEYQEMTSAIAQEREDLLEQTRELSKHIQFQTMLLQHFVPREQAQMIESRAVWDDALNMYVLRKFNFKESLVYEKRPRSVYGCVLKPHNPEPRDSHNKIVFPPGMKTAEPIPPFVLMSPRPVTRHEMEMRTRGEGGIQYGMTNIMQSSLDLHERTTQELAELGLDLE